MINLLAIRCIITSYSISISISISIGIFSFLLIRPRCTDAKGETRLGDLVWPLDEDRGQSAASCSGVQRRSFFLFFLLCAHGDGDLRHGNTCLVSPTIASFAQSYAASMLLHYLPPQSSSGNWNFLRLATAAAAAAERASWQVPKKDSTLVCNSQTRSFSPFFQLPERRILFSSCRQNWRRENLCGFSAFTVLLRMSGVMRRTFFLFRRGICCCGRRWWWLWRWGWWRWWCWFWWEEIRKRTGVDWGCDPLSLENGTLLKEWLSTEGLAKQKLELERVESGGRGLVAKQSLRQGERLLFVPSRLIITAQSVWYEPLFFLTHLASYKHIWHVLFIAAQNPSFQ